MVRYEWGKATCEKLKEWGYNVDFRTYAYVDPWEQEDRTNSSLVILPIPQTQRKSTI